MPRRDLAIDLGTSNTRVFQQGAGVVYDEPTVVAVNGRTGEVLAAGREVWDLMEEATGVVPVRPLERGVVTDFDTTLQMLRLIFRRLAVPRFPKPRAIVCVPADLTSVEQRAVEEATAGAGAGGVSLVDQPLAAAIGAGLPVQDPVGSMVVDVGGGMARMAMVSMGGVVNGCSVRTGGFDIDGAIQQHVRRRYGVAIGDAAAERIKIEVGSAYPAADAHPADVQGREVSTGMPVTITVTPDEIRGVLEGPVHAIVDRTRTCLAESPPELAHDVLDTGLFLAGGGGLLRGLDMRMAHECEVPVHVAEQPLRTVVMGAGHLLDYLPELRGAFFATSRRS